MKLFAGKSRSAKGKSDAKRGNGKGSTKPRPAAPHAPTLSNDQLVDIIGYGLLGVSVVTILSWISNQRGDLTGTWIAALAQGFGWGAIVAPVLMGATGLYLVLRRFGDRFPGRRPAASWACFWPTSGRWP